MTDAATISGDMVRPADPARIPPLPTFTEFHRAINGRDPFPWQARLADCVARQERWPHEIGVPTGLGKTACLDIAVWWLSSQADRPPALRTAPTRIWWVVDRRLLVDSTAEHAGHLANLLCDSASAGLEAAGRHVIERVAARLRSLWVDPAAPPLDVVSLRGGIASRTPTDPARPTVILCTLSMYGSRLLFRGHGSSRPSVDAAMAGTDSLILLDEAHSAVHLKTLVPALAACNPAARDFLGVKRSRPTVVSLTATGDAARSDRFDLDDDDEAHPEVRRRLDAAKPLRIDIAAGESARRLAEATVALVRKAPAPAACLVFCNTPKTARETFERLGKRLPEAQILLLTGLVREREAARIRARLLDPEHGMATARPADAPRRHHLIVVATQTLEVGADIDAEYLVTEACGVRALTQRMGRLNRLGRFPHAHATYVHLPSPWYRDGIGSDAKAYAWPVYGREPETVRERLLSSRAGRGAGTVDLSPRSIASVLGPPLEDPDDRAPEVLPGLLWEWTKTTAPPEGEAPVEPYFSGIAAPRLSVALIWRAHVPSPGERLWPRGTDREAIDVPLAEAREVLEDATMRRLASDGVTVAEVSADDLRPGDRIVVAGDAGHMDQFGWNPDSSDPVADASLADLGLPLDADAIRRLCGSALDGLVDTALGNVDDDRDVDEEERSEAVADILATLRDTPVPPGWQEAEWIGYVGRLQPRVVEPRSEVPRLPVERPAGESPSEECDELSLGPVAVELDRHGRAVGRRAGTVAAQVGLTDDLVKVVERAATLHDIGKADARFQRWLDPRHESGRPLAKSDAPRHRWEAMRVSSGWPRGGRHEDLSARLVCAWLAQRRDWGSPLQRDLLVHLVISHHGKGRPLVPPAVDGTPASVSAVVDGVSVTANADLATIDWEQPGRFRRLQEQLGPWGLALLEAIVIRADHAVSAGVDGTPEDT
ncbi:MAG: type I-U CRISPR-associated helicase/endonuclease Cas3 [Thiotrichales bacterium]|nr:type I-U CRISPR-associated helicase/endonuclease Cas3 [Thiotrichales bacterium]